MTTGLSFDAEAIADGIARWAAVESPSFDPAGVNRMMDLAEAEMRALGANVERVPGTEGYGDAVRARLDFGHADDRPGILVLGHLDTVHLVGTLDDTLPIRRDGDRLFGPGVLDMKGGMYLACHAVRKLLEYRERLNLPLTFLFIPDEEIGSPSTRALIEETARANRYVLVPEPGKPAHFVSGRHAFLRYKLHCYGQPAHAGVAVGVGRSSISVMARLIAQVESWSDVDREMTFRVGTITGGTFVNVIPTECHAEVLCVAPDMDAFAEVQQRMSSIVSPDPDVRVEVEAGPVRPLFQPQQATLELLEVAQRIARDVGLELGHAQFGGGSDGNFTGALGIPTLDGLGVEGTGVHTKQEHLLVSSLVPRARLFSGLVAALSDRNA
ncbi:M20/M25/M40 family metallo-hydrolase [Minwuia sp.]|uniref:M20/M25/M40 family metallo-hydrolase n=1 Tax=Minwuia sp. TaxID=2493630 RepID=UPI003A929357